MENPGIDPGTSRMLSERSTTWANSPLNNSACIKHKLNNNDELRLIPTGWITGSKQLIEREMAAKLRIGRKSSDMPINELGTWQLRMYLGCLSIYRHTCLHYTRALTSLIDGLELPYACNMSIPSKQYIGMHAPVYQTFAHRPLAVYTPYPVTYLSVDLFSKPQVIRFYPIIPLNGIGTAQTLYSGLIHVYIYIVHSCMQLIYHAAEISWYLPFLYMIYYSPHISRRDHQWYNTRMNALIWTKSHPHT